MRKLPILLLFCCITYFTQAQDAKELLKKCFEKCQAINNGHFISTVALKSELYPENVSKSNVTFRKTNNDSVSPCLFYAQLISKGDINRYSLYTGKEYVSYVSSGDIGEIVPNDKYGSDAIIKCRSDIYLLFEPFMAKNSSPLPKYSDFESQSTYYEFINIESVNGFKCWHVQTTRTIKNDSTQLVKYNKYTNQYWININDTIPVQYLLTNESLVDRDTRIFYKKVAVESYELNNITSDALFKLTAVPKYVNLREFVPKPKLVLLKRGAVAPSFRLNTIDDKIIKFKDLKGKLVLLSFVSNLNSSMGKMSAIGLQSIHEKFPNLELIILCCLDKDIDRLKLFTKNNAITLPVISDCEDVKKSYYVAVYPTYYLIDENGKVLSSYTGYSNKVTEKQLEDAITNHLLLKE